MAHVATHFIKLFAPWVPPGAEARLGDVLASGQLAQGPKVAEFEYRFAERFAVPHAIAMNSGTAAMETAYDLLGLEGGDEVITTPLTCTATNLPLLRRDCRIVWADVERDTLCLDPADVERKITDRTKAIVQVHLGGIQANVHTLGFPVPVVSDACQALGIFVGDYTACSFQAIKHLTTGDGGMLVVPDAMQAHQAKLLRWFGIDRERKIPDTWESYRTRMMSCAPEVLGAKRHMNDLAAMLGLEGLKHYDANLAHRLRLAEVYQERLTGIAGIQVLRGRRNVSWLCTVLVEQRDNFAKMLYTHGVECNLVQVRNDAFPIFGGRARLPVLDELEGRYVSLPMGPHVSLGDVEFICSRIERGW